MWQPIFMINGYLITILGLAMLIPGFVDMHGTDSDWSPFFTTSLITIFTGLSLYILNKTDIKKITIQQGYLLTVFSWFGLTFLATLPFILHGSFNSFIDAFFEASSCISTTGATVINDLDAQPRSILLWRSLLTVMGGVGIVIFAVAMLPFLGIGGMQIFHNENSDINDKILPKFSYIAKEILLIYFSMLVLCVVSLHFAGMSYFDAINHAMASVATSGLSTQDTSIAYYNSFAIEFVLMIFMIMGSIPLSFYIMLFQHQDAHTLRGEQVSFFLKTLLFYIMLTASWLWYTGVYDLTDALRFASFNVISSVTTTGYYSADYTNWGAFASTLFIVFQLTGGCTGSTTGSIKIFRWQVVFAYLKKSLMIATEPNRVVPVKIGSINIDYKIVGSVFLFLSVYALSIVIMTALVSLTGIEFGSALSLVVACITSSGSSGDYASLSDFAKYALAFTMLFGRLEILTVIVIFTRGFWRN